MLLSVDKLQGLNEELDVHDATPPPLQVVGPGVSLLEHHPRGQEVDRELEALPAIDYSLLAPWVLPGLVVDDPRPVASGRHIDAVDPAAELDLDASQSVERHRVFRRQVRVVAIPDLPSEPASLYAQIG